MNIVKYRNIFLSIGALIVAAAIGVLSVYGLDLGIDFTGGSILEVSFDEQRPAITQTEEVVAQTGAENVSVRPTGEEGYIIRTGTLEEGQKQRILESLSTLASGEESATSTTATSSATSTEQVGQATSSTSTDLVYGGVTQNRFASIGPTVGSEITRSAIYGIIAVVTAIILFVTFAFRKVSEPVSSWMYGSVAIAALIHDILLPTAVFAVLGMLFGAQVDLLFVMALLAILGYSVNDTIVVFDRVRENLQENYEKDSDDSFAKTVGRSLSDTYVRSINTSLTTFTVLFCLYMIGGDATEYFALTLLVGVLAGTYSSIFIASPLLVKVREWQTGKEEVIN